MENMITLNFKQNEVYRIATQGVKALQSNKQFNVKEIISLEKRTKRNQNVINRYKQTIMIKRTNKLFQQFFHSKDAKAITSMKETDNSFFCNLPMKDLGIANKGMYNREYIYYLVQNNVLPTNFYSL